MRRQSEPDYAVVAWSWSADYRFSGRGQSNENWSLLGRGRARAHLAPGPPETATRLGLPSVEPCMRSADGR